MLQLVGEWHVSVRTPTTAADASTPEPAAETERTASLTFDGDGQVFGTGGVNRLRGTWSVDGDELRFGPMASTLMAGPPAAMRQEAELLRLLAEPLELRAADGAALSAADPLLERTEEDSPAAVVELVAPAGDGLVLTRADAPAPTA
ncbi:MAG: META domain-containing protein [Cellulomonas sp.]|uniref:DUF306 domain-containing protein n=1 Tax=Cellulomonas gelida TaxID=1712 RepID=A0A4Y3KGM4_9CELL|nr:MULTISPECIES: META domain-containing protein [Cellulomonas]MCR6648058.1 META domain-containing protein [Cellulomonas sp.]GEA83559.1 hypothetical protein CGE01nite_08100 [Cellulomonas gelida]GGL23978.1 hypothetical protein GCM10009774_13090 [Cellulomonas gelida]